MARAAHTLSRHAGNAAQRGSTGGGWVGLGGSPSSAAATSLCGVGASMTAASDLPPLVRVGLLHAQFETLHPYLDGNGRLGRLLIALPLRRWGLLSRPLLYLSLFLKMHRQEYYRRLDAIRTDGDWEGWLGYFCGRRRGSSRQAVATSRHLHAIVAENRERLHARDDATVLSLRQFEQLPQHPIVTVNRAVEMLECSRPAAAEGLRVLEGTEVLCALGRRK